MTSAIPISHLSWNPCWRLVPSKFPPVSLFDRVAEPEDLDIVFSIEGLTNDRLRDEVGDISLVSPDERVSGPGTTPIMAAFTHLNPQGSRFTDGTYGVYYAAIDIDTAIAETCFHRTRFLAATKEPAIEVDMRSYASDLEASFHDIRNMQASIPDVYAADPDDYAPAQSLAREMREKGSSGILYNSVRKAGGECVAIFRPRVLSPVRQGSHYCYVWNGKEITAVYIKISLDPVT